MTITPKVFKAARPFTRGGQRFAAGDEVTGGALVELLRFDADAIEPPFLTTTTTNTPIKKEGITDAADS